MNQVEVVAACRVAALVGSQLIDIDNRIDEAEPGISSPDSTRAPVALLLHIVPSAASTPPR